MPEEPMNYPLWMGLLTTGTGLMDYPSRYTKYPRSYTEDAGRALREGISTWAQMYPSYRREQQDYALQQQALEEKQQEKQRFSQILGKLRQQPLPGMNPAMIDQISMLDPKRGLDTLYNMYSGVKPVQEFKTLSSQEEIEHFGSDLPGNFQIGYDKKITQIAGSKPPEVKAPDPIPKDKKWAYSILNQILMARQNKQPGPEQYNIDTAAAILEAGSWDPQAGQFVKQPLPPALAQARSSYRPNALKTLSGQGLVHPKKGDGISHVLTSAGLEYNQDNVIRFLKDNGVSFNENGSVKTYGPKFDPPQGRMKFPDNMPGLRIELPYSVGALDRTMVEQINKQSETIDKQYEEKLSKAVTVGENREIRRQIREEQEERQQARMTTKIKGKAIEQVETNHNLMKTLYKMARVIGGTTFADKLTQRADAQGNMKSLVKEGFTKTAISELRDAGVGADSEGVGFEFWGETAGALSMMHSDTFNMIRKAYEFGAPQQAEFQFFEEMLANPTHLLNYFDPKQWGWDRGRFQGQLRMMFQQANTRAKIWETLSKGSGMDPVLIGKLRGMKVFDKDEKGIDQWDAFTDISPNQSRNQYRADNQYEIKD